MKKSFHVLAAVVVFAMMGGLVFAYAPVLKPLPSVFISDVEDFAGTVDLNMFRFSDAFDLDAYVTDEDSTISELVWSFWEGGAGYLEVNGLTELADPADAINADILGKDIRHAAAPYDDSLVDFWDELDSPRGTGPPFQGGDPAYVPVLDEIVTFFVSDGLFVDSGQLAVKADGLGDRVSDTTVWEPVRADDFEGSTDGWTFTGPSANAPDSRFIGAFSGTTASALTIRTDDVTNRFGFWAGPAVALNAGKLHKFEWTLTTDQANPNLVPTARLRGGNGEWSNEYVVTSDGVSNPNAITATEKVYRQYILPPVGATADINPSFDVYDFTNPGDIGTVRMELFDAYITDVPATGWTALTAPAFGSWAVTNGPGVYNNLTTGTTGGLQLGSTLANSYHYGFWGTGLSGAVKYQATDKLYRAVFNIRSADTANPWCMVRVGAQDFQVSNRLTAYTPVQPDTDGNPYALYFEAHDYVSGLDGFDLFFEMGDFENNKGGTQTLTSVTVEYHDLLP